MNKPKLLLFSGWQWAATSPLIYTLQRNVKYAHFGYTKGFKYLSKPIWKDYKWYFSPKHPNNALTIYERVKKGIWGNYKSYTPGTHRMNLRVDLEPLDDFSLDHLSKLVTGAPTIKKYMDFYHALYDHVVTKGYKCVGDTQMGRLMREDWRFTKIEYDQLFTKYTEALKSEFDVKVLFIARDPVRRAFSQYITKIQKKNDGRHSSSLATEEISLGKKHRKSLGKLPIRLEVHDYVQDINKVRKFFKDNLHCIVMEELWERDGATVLSEFLEHPIKKSDLWKNLYAPDKGHLVEYDKDVPCQAYGQDLLELTPQTYDVYRKRYNHIYKSWVREFGSLPLHWGEPIDYKSNK